MQPFWFAGPTISLYHIIIIIIIISSSSSSSSNSGSGSGSSSSSSSSSSSMEFLISVMVVIMIEKVIMIIKIIILLVTKVSIYSSARNEHIPTSHSVLPYNSKNKNTASRGKRTLHPCKRATE
jgi:hypothetical protein